MKKIIITTLISVFVIGCTSFQTIDVKNNISTKGLYAGFRQQGYSSQEDNKIYRNYFDVGYSHPFKEENEPRSMDFDYNFLKGQLLSTFYSTSFRHENTIIVILFYE